MTANGADDRHFLQESIETGVFVLILRPHEAEEAPHIGKTPAPGCISVHSGISAIYFARPYNKRCQDSARPSVFGWRGSCT